MKLNLLITSITLFVLNFSANAQFNLNWNSAYQHTPSVNFSNESRKVVMDPAGNSYVLADVTSNIDPSGNSGATTYHYVVILKYNSAGTLLLSKNINVINHTISGFNNLGAFGLEIGADGFLYIGYNNYNSTTNFNVNVCKYNPANLIRVWNRNFNPASADRGIELKTGTGGIVYAIIQSTTGSSTRYHILKSDTGGSTSIALYSFNPDVDFLKSMVVAANNDVYVTGYQNQGGIKSALTVGVKETGVLKWQRIYNGGSSLRDDYGTKLILTSSNNLYICGNSDRGSPNLNDVMVLNYSTAGKFNWVNYLDYNHGNEIGMTLKNAGTNGIYVGYVSGINVVIDRVEIANGIVSGRALYQPAPMTPYNSIQSISIDQMFVSAAKNIYVTGTVTALSANNEPFSGGYLVKYSPKTTRAVAITDAFKFEYDLDVEGDAMTSYTVSDFAIKENTAKVIWLRNKFESYANHSKEVILISQYSIPSPVRVIDNQNINLKENFINIFPNPVEDILTVSSDKIIEKIEIFDINGKLISTHSNIFSEFDEMDFSSLPGGVYQLRIYGMDGTMDFSKIIKQ